jgi:CRISPR-associated protein Cas5d
MLPESPPFHVRVSGPFALFTRPEMKAERVSYDVMTPSAARGVLEAVLWKPGMRWVIQRITVLNPIRHVAVKRNEVASKVSSDATEWARQNRAGRPFFADDDRQQRNALLLRDVDYVVDAVIRLTDRAGSDDSIVKFVEMFRRRVDKGQHFHHPYLGCREFPATVSLATGSECPNGELLGQDVELGWMLQDIEYEDGRPKRPHFFQAHLRDGIVEIPSFAPGEPS